MKDQKLMSEEQQQQFFNKQFSAAALVSNSFANLFDKDFKDTMTLSMRYLPGMDVKCPRNFDHHKQRMSSGAFIVCYSCQGTDRRPVPLQEIIQRDDY